MLSRLSLIASDLEPKLHRTPKSKARSRLANDDSLHQHSPKITYTLHGILLFTHMSHFLPFCYTHTFTFNHTPSSTLTTHSTHILSSYHTHTFTFSHTLLSTQTAGSGFSSDISSSLHTYPFTSNYQNFNMSSTSTSDASARPVIHTYTLRDQSGTNAPGRKSMLLGTTRTSKRSIWVSFDKRPQGDHTRYWSEDNKAVKYSDFNNHLVYTSGLELSRFTSKRKPTSKRKTTSQLAKKKNQKSLIQRVYNQGGKQYRGDLEAIEEDDEARRQQRKKKKSRHPTSKKAKTTKNSTDKRVHLFQTDALQLTPTNDTAKHVHADMVDE